MATNTAATFTSHTGNNTAGPFSISFSYLSEDEIDVTVGGVLKTKTTHYTFPSATTISFTSGNHPANGAAIKFQRDTNISAKKVDFVDGAILTEADLDTNTEHLLYGIQEVLNHVDTKEFTSAQIANGTIVNADVNASAAIDGTKISPNFGSQNIATTGTVDGRDVSADGSKLDGIDAGAKDDQTAAEIKTLLQSDKLTASEIANGTITATQIATGALDGRYYTETESDAKYFNVSTGDTIKDGDTFPDNDTTIATTAAINDRIIDLVDDVGGFVPIANETSFPAANPDVNNGTGTLVSVKAFASSHTPSSGTVTIANGAGSGNTVTITGCGSTVLAAGFGGILETTSTLHTYTFHRLTPKATEVTTVAGNISNINTVAGISANVTTVAGISANVTTVATNITNVNNVGRSIANVNTVATNISSVNDFAARYRIASSDPTSSLDVGDIVFNTSSNELRVYNGSAWQGGVTATGDLLSRTSDLLDEDNFASNSATKVASQQSIKAYVDTADALKADLSGATFTGDVVFTGDAANLTWDKSTDDLIFNDNAKAIFGTGSDLQIYHDGSNSYLDNSTGDLFIRNNSNAIKIRPKNDEESIVAHENGAVELFYDNTKTFETHQDGISVYAREGHGAELTLSADEGDDNADRWKFTAEADGGLYIQNYAGGSWENTIYAGGNGPVNLYYDGSLQCKTASYGLDFADNKRADFGSSSDLLIYHDGTHSYIADSGTGNLNITASKVNINNAANSETMASFLQDGAVKLYYDGVEKCYTGPNGLKFNDSDKALFGNSGDLEIYHDGSHSYINESGTGNLRIKSDNAVLFETDNFTVNNESNSDNLLIANNGGAVELYYDNSKKLETVNTGVEVFGDIFGSGKVDLPDNGKLMLGTGDDLQIYHDGTNNYIKHVTSGAVYIETTTNLNLRVNSSENAIIANANGSVELYYDNSKKLQTNGAGVDVFENLYLGDNVNLKFGTGADLQIYHDGSNNNIKSTNGHVNLYLPTGKSFSVGNSDFTEDIFKATENGAVNLYYDGSLKLNTTSTGVDLRGTVHRLEGTLRPWSSTDTDIGTDSDRFRNIYVYNDIDIKDDGKLLLGDGGDLEIYHNGNQSYIRDEGPGSLIITSSEIHFKNVNNSETIAKFLPNGNNELYYDNSKKLETITDGINITGKITTNDGDIVINNDGSNGYITNKVGSLHIRPKAGEEGLVTVPDGTTKIYYDASKKLETTSSGVTVTGSVTETSDVSLKNDINTIQNPLELIEQIRGINFTWKNNGTKSMGVIAQDVEKVFPELVHGQEGSKSLQYSGLIGALVESVKELSAKVSKLENA